jgi:proteic killer suppression protein
MILRFRHKGLEALLVENSGRKLPAQHVKRLRLILAALETASLPADMDLAGLRLHPLGGNRKGAWAVWVSGNWRVVFEFDGRNVTNVDLVDYH